MWDIQKKFKKTICKKRPIPNKYYNNSKTYYINIGIYYNTIKKYIFSFL